MKPVVTPTEMGDIDAAAPEPVDVLIERAGAAVARHALSVVGGAYGRRVVVLAGKGNNGNDGRAAARRLARRGVRTEVIDAAGAPGRLRDADLVIDAAYGTGFHGEFDAPDTGDIPVLAVDIPSGVDGTTGVASGRPLQAACTVTFAALKPGLLLGDGRRLAGEVAVADIGLDVSRARAGVVERDDVARWVPVRAATAHKWRSAVLVVAGSPGMSGAASLCAGAAQRAGAGMVRLASPGVVAGGSAPPIEAVGVELPDDDWAGDALAAADRCHAVVVGPGLGRSAAAVRGVRELVAGCALPMLVDGDGLAALADHLDVIRGRAAPTVLTPHDGEFARLAGAPPDADRFASVRELAARTGAVVLLKGPPVELVASPDGYVHVVDEGDERLATAGTGDVLSGIVGALLAQGIAATEAAAAGAWLHGRAARLAPRHGFISSDLLPEIGPAIAEATR